jgi:hypothetical protein
MSNKPNRFCLSTAFFKIATLLMVVCLFSVFAFGQHDGVPTFGAADVRGSGDVIDLITLAPTINVPVTPDITLTSKQQCTYVNNGITKGPGIFCTPQLGGVWGAWFQAHFSGLTGGGT